CAFLIAAYFVPTMRELLTSLLPIELGSTATATYVGEYFLGRYGSEAYAEIYEFSHFALGFLTVELFAAVLFVAVGHKSVTVGLWRYQETLLLLGVVALTLLLLFLPTMVCDERPIRKAYKCADGQGPWLALWVSALMTSVLLPLFPAFLISMAKRFLRT
ncbi:MAG: hypothetical protein AAFY01_12175, partial [Pseudomonadota bacterium]